MISLNKLSTVVLLSLFAGCASNPDSQTVSRNSSYQCPRGETMVCEVRNTGRITHGSFSKRGKNCTCQDESREGPAIIPEIRQ